MRMGRTLTLLTLFAGIATWFATREAMRRSTMTGNAETDDTMRWDTDGGTASEASGASTGTI